MNSMSELTFETVDGTTQANGSRSRGRVVKLDSRKKEKGIAFAQFSLALAAGGGSPLQALEIAKNRLGESSDVVTVLKAAVSAGSTSSPDWAAPLVPAHQNMVNDFVSYLRPRTIVGRFGVGGTPDMRRIGFRFKAPTQITGGAASWVREGFPIPLTAFNFASIELDFAKLGALAVITRELIQWSNPNAELIVRDGLAAAIIERLDRDFVDPAKAEVANVSPASITNGIPALPSVGGYDIEAVKQDIEALFFAFLNADNPPDNAVFLMSSKLAFRLSALQNMFGTREFPAIHFGGGSLMGLPVITSNYIADDRVILVNPSDIYFADGGLHIDASDSVSIEMRDDPTNDSVSPTGATMTSMFQTGSVALKVLKAVNYKRRRASAVSWLSGVQWGAHGSS